MAHNRGDKRVQPSRAGNARLYQACTRAAQTRLLLYSRSHTRVFALSLTRRNFFKPAPAWRWRSSARGARGKDTEIHFGPKHKASGKGETSYGNNPSLPPDGGHIPTAPSSRVAMLCYAMLASSGDRGTYVRTLRPYGQRTRRVPTLYPDLVRFSGTCKAAATHPSVRQIFSAFFFHLHIDNIPHDLRQVSLAIGYYTVYAARMERQKTTHYRAVSGLLGAETSEHNQPNGQQLTSSDRSVPRHRDKKRQRRSVLDFFSPKEDQKKSSLVNDDDRS